MRIIEKIIGILLLACLLQGCIIGSVIGTTVDAAIEVIKVPFKVGGAVKDVVTDEDELRQVDKKSRTTDVDDSTEPALTQESLRL